MLGNIGKAGSQEWRNSCDEAEPHTDAPGQVGQ